MTSDDNFDVNFINIFFVIKCRMFLKNVQTYLIKALLFDIFYDEIFIKEKIQDKMKISINKQIFIIFFFFFLMWKINNHNSNI